MDASGPGKGTNTPGDRAGRCAGTDGWAGTLAAVSDVPDPGREAEDAAWSDFMSPPETPAPRLVFTTRQLTVAAAVGAALVIILTVVMWPGRSYRDQASDLSGFVATEQYEAVVIDISDGPCTNCIDVTFELVAGPDDGLLVVQTFSSNPVTAFRDGDRVVMGYLPDSPEEFRYQFFDRQRRGVLWIVALLFAAAVVLLGRMRGLAALGGLVASLGVLFWFVLPGILDGKPPVAVAVVGAALIAYLALYVAHGFRPLTTVALIGTLGALALTALLSLVVVEAAQLTGFASEEAGYLTLIGRRDNMFMSGSCGRPTRPWDPAACSGPAFASGGITSRPPSTRWFWPMRERPCRCWRCSF